MPRRITFTLANNILCNYLSSFLIVVPLATNAVRITFQELNIFTILVVASFSYSYESETFVCRTPHNHLDSGSRINDRWMRDDLNKKFCEHRIVAIASAFQADYNRGFDSHCSLNLCIISHKVVGSILKEIL